MKEPPRSSALTAGFPPLGKPRGGFGSVTVKGTVPELKTAALLKLSKQLEKLVPFGTATFSCFAEPSHTAPRCR